MTYQNIDKTPMTGYEVWEYIINARKETGKAGLCLSFYVDSDRKRYDGRHIYYISASIINGRKQLYNPARCSDRFFLCDIFYKVNS